MKHLLDLKNGFISLLSVIFLVACTKTVEHDLVIANVNIIDVTSGEIFENRTVAIDSCRIAAIYNKKPAFNGLANVIDGHGKFLIPGLWDMHTHYNWNHEDSDPLLIANGITGVREMWGNMIEINEVRKKTQAGEIIAPDIYSAGVIIDGSPSIWPGSIAVNAPEEARHVVEKQIDEGVDFIKVYSMLSEECFLAIADAATQNNIPFAGHVPNSLSIYKAIDAGMASSEHLYGFIEACSSMEDSIRKLNSTARIKLTLETFSEEKFDSLCSVLAQSNMWICPTLTVLRAIGYLNDTVFIGDERLAYVPEYLKSSWNPKNDFRFTRANDEYYELHRARYHFEKSLIGKMNGKGVKILAGTDYPNPYCFPGFSLHDELALLVEGGMPEFDAMKTATINASVFMGKENEFGTIEPGKMASLILLNKNPLENIKNTKSIETVILRGKPFNKNALDKMLEQAKTNAAKVPYSFWLRGKISSDGIEQALDSIGIMIESNDNRYKLQESDINSLGYEYLNSGEIETAQSIFYKNIELFPESFNVYDSYAETCMKAGQYEQATEFYNKSLNINPYNENAKNMLDSIKVILKE